MNKYWIFSALLMMVITVSYSKTEDHVKQEFKVSKIE